jgi:hypothetical protein
MEERYTLGVDLGTSSSKGVLADRAGAIVVEASVAHGVDMPRPGFFEQDADGVWWRERHRQPCSPEWNAVSSLASALSPSRRARCSRGVMAASICS